MWMVGYAKNTPIRPVIRSGARHILLVSGRRAPNTQAPPTERQAVPNLMYLAGKSLNALLLDQWRARFGSCKTI